MAEVEKGAEKASSQEEVEKKGSEASTELSSKDIADLAEALKGALDTAEEFKAKAAKAEEERDNYKKGMLKAKGKLKDDDGAEDEDGEEEKSEKADDSSELASIVKQLLKRNAELVTAVVNKSQVATAGQGAGSDTKVEPGDNLLSKEQVADLKARGWDDKKIALFKQKLQSAKA